jgi:putative oxidoreductase
MATSEAVQGGVELGTGKSAGKGLRVALWIVQGLLAVGFGMAGLTKLGQPIAEMAKSIPWVTTVPESLVRFIGISELAGALGLILPSVTRIKPVLTAWAAVGLVAVMVLAAAFHISRGEVQMLPVPIVLGGMAAFVGWGRFGKARIAARS